jgi:DNA-binding GntR family transcriptional regulator
MTSPIRAVAGRGQAFERAYQGLKRAIMSGDMLPGERLVVADLARRHGTSSMPIRQALHRLVAERALDERPNRGVEVPRLDIEALMDLRRVRCAVEGQAAQWAAQTINPAELARLRQLQQRMRAIGDVADAGDYLALNVDFHFTTYRAARSPLLIPLIESLWLRVGPYLNTMRTETTLGLGLDQHDEVLAALERGDGVGARAAVERELSEAAEIMARALAGGAAAETPPTRRLRRAAG